MLTICLFNIRPARFVRNRLILCVFEFNVQNTQPISRRAFDPEKSTDPSDHARSGLWLGGPRCFDVTH